MNTFINAYTHLLSRQGESLDYMKQITMPVDIIGGDRDQIFARSCYEQTLKAIPHAKLHLLHGGHMVIVEKLNEFAKLINTILTSEKGSAK